jgi:hypothetical protein
MPESKLVQSSPSTRSWLQSLRDQLPDLTYSETKYWAAFRALRTDRAVAYLNPSRGGIRLFLAIDPKDHDALQPTPSSSSWAARFPSVFPIADEGDLPEAARFIAKSHAAMSRLPGGKAVRRPEHVSAEELLADAKYLEGAARRVAVNAYERNRQAREACLRHYGRTCIVCGFDFESTYGSAAAGYIQVHHVVPIAQIGRAYRLDAIEDLRPVCPNCHAVIHRREPPFSIKEVRMMLGTNGQESHQSSADRKKGAGVNENLELNSPDALA